MHVSTSSSMGQKLIIIRFQIRRAIARALTQSPIKTASKQIVQCQVRRSIAVQIQATRAFSQVRSYRAEETDKPEIQEHASATAESTDTVSESLEPADAETQQPPEPPTVDQSRLFIANIDFGVTQAEIQEQFSGFGPIEEVTLALDNLGRSRGFAHVKFQSAEDAAKAVQQMHGSMVKGRELQVIVSQPRINARPKRANRDPRAKNVPGKTLYIGNLSYKMTDADLNELFRNIKNVIDVRVAIDRRTGQPRGFAHADFTDTASATAAKEILETKSFHDRQLRLDYSTSSARADAEGL